MTGDARTDRRSLQDVVDTEAPVPPARATAIAVAVARHLESLESAGLDAGSVDASRVLLAADGSVAITGVGGGRRPDADEAGGGTLGTEGGASVGRLLFELLTGRPPLGREDAHEPAVTTALTPELCALLARSFSDAPGQWPDAHTWRCALESEIGGLAPPLTPRQAATARRRRVLVALGMAVLVTATVVILLLAPRWWDSLSEESQAPAQAPTQSSRTWSYSACTSSRICSLNSEITLRGTLPEMGTSG